MQNPPTAGFGAKCAIHPDRAASRTCARCGNFTCDECNLGGSEANCPRCLVLGGSEFPFNRGNVDFSGIWNFAFERWKQEWVMLSVCVLILFAIGMVSAIFNGVFQTIAKAIVGDRGGEVGVAIIAGLAAFMGQIFGALVQGFATMGLYRVYIDVLNGRKADVSRMMTQLPKMGRYVLQLLLMGVMFLVPLMLYLGLVVVIAARAGGITFDNLEHFERHIGPATGMVFVIGWLIAVPALIYFGLPLQLATYELVYGDTQPMESIRRAYKLADGFRTSLFGYGFMGGLVAMVGLLACCIGILPGLALAQLLITGLYLALRNGSGLPAPPEA